MSNISGLSVAYVTAGIVLMWSGVQNLSVADTLKGFIGGNVPKGTPTGAPSIGIGDNSSDSDSSSDTSIPPSGQGTVSYSQAETLWVVAGGPSSEASVAAAIADAESTLNEKAVQQGEPYSGTGWGLWQITPGDSVPSVGVNDALLNGLTNARAAVYKYKQAGNSFSPWTTYTGGRYLDFLKG